MYSVLIMNKRTKESFREFQPLFVEALGNNIGCCRWLESGGTVDTALPTLRSLIEDKEEWQAIIVRVEDEGAMSKYKTAPDNPYDFLDNYDEKTVPEGSAQGKGTARVSKDEHVESVDDYEAEKDEGIKSLDEEFEASLRDPIPLVRLTHMLGGMPEVEINYERREILEETKEKRFVYEPTGRDEERCRINALLSKRYDFDGKRPERILVVTLRDATAKNRRSNLGTTWANPMELNSSSFWKRNNYPSKCRFMVFDYEREGQVQLEASMFNFWCSILLLATNDINPSSLQAYRLYNVRADINRDSLEEKIQEKANEIAHLRNYINEEIRRAVTDKLEKHNEEEDAVSYGKEISVPLRNVDHGVMLVEYEDFGLCNSPRTPDLTKWETRRETAEKELDQMCRKAERGLEESSDSVRLYSEIDEYDVKVVDRFAQEDIEEDLHKRFDNILEVQGTLPNTKLTKRGVFETRSQNIVNAISARLKRSTFFITLAHLLGAAVFAFYPAVIFYLNFKVGHVSGAALYSALMFAVMFTVSIIVLIVQRKKFINRIEAYNLDMAEETKRIGDSIEQYEKYTSDITSHIRGRRYLRILAGKNERIEEENSLLYKHYRISGRFTEKLRRWCKAFYLNVDFEAETRGTYIYNTKTDPCKDVMYSIEVGQEYQIPFNETGEKIVSPFEFVTRLEIYREELYNDDRTAKSK